MSSKLQEAVAIFKELGWENVTTENILSLPLGTAEQKRAALDGLKSGDWGEIAELKKNTYGYRSHVDVDENKLALFAIRIGVNAQRAANILRAFENDIIVKVIADRGIKYASDFINYACVSRRRAWEHSASAYGSVAVYLVDRLNMGVPQNVEYIKDWSVYAAAAMGLKAELRHRDETDLPGIDVIEKRFVEHIQIGIAVNAPATGPFGAVLPAGVKRGWLSRDNAVMLVLSALDASVRPGDRKVWLGVLDELGISEEELCSNIQSLIPLMSTGDSAVVTRLAPVLIAGADSNLLTEVLLSTLSATTKKARQLVLKSALDRSCPNNAEELASWLSMLASDKDKSVASLAERLMKKWKISADVFTEEITQLCGLWQNTPPVWDVMDFELGEVSPEELTELAAKIVSQPNLVHDVTAERFLAMVNAVAYKNPEAARNSLRGLRFGLFELKYLVHSLLDYIVCWVKKEKPNFGHDTGKKGFRAPFEPPLTARDYVVSLHLGELPCILSTPSAVDLSIRVPDLAKRLALYQKTGTDALEADLMLAMTRLDEKTKTPEAVLALQTLNVPIVLQSGEIMTVSAGQAVRAYLTDPVIEPPLVNENG
ncbi:MAG: PRTRC system protein E, partial [Oscillospiraceae bacterium]|nr:PRTRC system protein E [Oscillospiraceae bacterium]